MKFKVLVKNKFEIVFDTIEKARAFRQKLRNLKYKSIVIRVEQDDINPYNKEQWIYFT